MNLERVDRVLKSIADFEIDTMLEKFPKCFREKINKTVLTEKVLDPHCKHVVKTLLQIQIATEKLFVQRMSFVLDKYLIELRCINSEDFEGKLMKHMLTLKYKEELKDLMLINKDELDRMVTMQLEFLNKLGIPGFYETNNEDEEYSLRQELLNQIIRIMQLITTYAQEISTE